MRLPTVTASKPIATWAKIKPAPSAGRRDSSVTASRPNVLNVVSAPQNPTATSGRFCTSQPMSSRPALAATYPIRPQPITFTLSVAHGTNARPASHAVASLTPYRTSAPIAPPTPTHTLASRGFIPFIPNRSDNAAARGTMPS